MGVWHLSHWTTREVPGFPSFSRLIHRVLTRILCVHHLWTFELPPPLGCGERCCMELAAWAFASTPAFSSLGCILGHELLRPVVILFLSCRGTSNSSRVLFPNALRWKQERLTGGLSRRLRRDGRRGPGSSPLERGRVSCVYHLH